MCYPHQPASSCKEDYKTIDEIQDLKLIKNPYLSCIKKNTDFPKRLQHWTYYDLQSKIEYKPAEQGIQVIKITPKFTSLRCSQCGCIHKDCFQK